MKQFTDKQIESYKKVKDLLDHKMEVISCEIDKIRSSYGYNTALISYDEMSNNELKDKTRPLKAQWNLLWQMLKDHNRVNRDLIKYMNNQKIAQGKCLYSKE